MCAQSPSRETILSASRRLLLQEGWSGVNIRSVASACGLSVGTIYHFFDSKAQLLQCTVESIWMEVFPPHSASPPFPHTLSYIQWIYQCLERGNQQYPGFLTHHSVAFLQEERATGRKQMEKFWKHRIAELSQVLQRDPLLSPQAFTPEFTPEIVAQLIFSLILSSILRQDYNAHPVEEMVRRSLYHSPSV